MLQLVLHWDDTRPDQTGSSGSGCDTEWRREKNFLWLNTEVIAEAMADFVDAIIQQFGKLSTTLHVAKMIYGGTVSGEFLN